jgi:hypothetical protein
MHTSTDEPLTVSEEFGAPNRFLTVVPKKLCENVCSPPAFGHVFVEPFTIDGVLL